MRILSAAEVRKALPMANAIDAMRQAFSAHGRGLVRMPLRTHLELNGVASLTMPASMREPDRLGAKLLTIVPANVERQLPVIQGVVVVFDGQSGAPKGLLEGSALTAIRTGAVSGLATDLLARKEATQLAVIGSGPQAETQLEAVCSVRNVTEARIYSRTRKNALRFVSGVQRRPFTPREITVVDSVAEAVDGADVVCTATRSEKPLLTASMVKAGVHVNAVGSYTPSMHEVDESILAMARVVVDDRSAALAEAGEVIHCMQRGVLVESAIVELGEIVEGRKAGRTGEHEITVFKSVGLAVQDLAAGAMAMERAEAEDLGLTVNL